MNFLLAWESLVITKHRRNCAFRFDAKLLTLEQRPAGLLEGHIILADRLVNYDLWGLCANLSQPLSELADEIMRYRTDLASSNLFFVDHLEIEPPFWREHLGIAAIEKITQIGKKRFDVQALFLKPLLLQYGTEPPFAASHREFKKSKRKLTSYYRKRLPIRILRKGSEFYFWKLE